MTLHYVKKTNPYCSNNVYKQLTNMGVPSEEVEGEMPAKKGRLDQDNHAQAPKSASTGFFIGFI